MSSYILCNLEQHVEDSGDNIVGKDSFKPGMDIYYKRGNGHNKTVRHINIVEVIGAESQKNQLSDGTLTNVPDCDLQLLGHPDLTIIPIDVETYCKEMESGPTTANDKQRRLSRCRLTAEFCVIRSHSLPQC